MKKLAIITLLLAVNLGARLDGRAQQIPFLSELLSRYAEFNRLYAEKQKTGVNLTSIEPLRKRAEDALKHGDLPILLEVISAAQAMLNGRTWDDRQRFIASLTVETDRLVLEPNQTLQVSLTRMYPVNITKTFDSTPTVTFAIVARSKSSKGETAQARLLAQPIVVAERIAIAETSSNAARRLMLPDGLYDVVAIVEAGNEKLAEIRRPFYAIGNFADSVAQMSKTVAALKGSDDPKIKALAPLIATPEFQLQRLAQLNKSRGELDLNPLEEIDRIEAALSTISKGANPFASQRGEVERAYQTADGKLVPYRVYLPKSYDGATARPLVLLLHGVLGDERYYFGGLFDAAFVTGEAERRGYILVGVNGRGRFTNYGREGLEDAQAVLDAVTRDYKVDSSRVYLMGHSSGAYGAWVIASSKPEKFAAIAAVSGGAPAQGDGLNSLLSRLKGVPALIAHGAQDGIVPVQLSRALAGAAEKAGLKVSYVELRDGDYMSAVASTFPAIMDFFDKSAKASEMK